MPDYTPVYRASMDDFFENLRNLLITCPCAEARADLTQFFKEYEDTFYVDNQEFRKIMEGLLNDDTRQSNDY